MPFLFIIVLRATQNLLRNSQYSDLLSYQPRIKELEYIDVEKGDRVGYGQ